jgi:hypothetical protein
MTKDMDEIAVLVGKAFLLGEGSLDARGLLLTDADSIGHDHRVLGGLAASV